jgi:hypothetical protein
VNPKLYAALVAGFHSTYITFLALAGGLLTAAAASGNAGSPGTLWIYIKANAFGYLIANIIAPTIRAAAAAKGT